MGPGLTKTDSQIQHDVLEELKWDTRLTATGIGVEVKAGVVTLTGTVTSWAERIAAQRAAHRVSSVQDVANDIHVRLPGSASRTDADIAAAVRSALQWDVLVPEARITSTVTNGVVTLEGTVSYWTQHDDAARCVRNLAGVREVKNLIAVDPPHVAALSVRGAIDNALKRHAEHASKHVTIAVVGDEVSLIGNVRSWAERDAIEGAVRGTPGVRHVDCQLRVEG